MLRNPLDSSRRWGFKPRGNDPRRLIEAAFPLKQVRSIPFTRRTSVTATSHTVHLASVSAAGGEHAAWT